LIPDVYSLLVIGNLVVLLYVVWVIGQVKEALAFVFIAIDELSRGNPVNITLDEDDNLNIRFPMRKDQDDDDE